MRITGRIATGLLPLQHHDQKFDVGAREYVAATRIVGRGTYNEYIRGEDHDGDIVCARFWPTNPAGRATTGAGGGSSTRDIPAYSFAFPVGTVGPAGEPDGDGYVGGGRSGPRGAAGAAGAAGAQGQQGPAGPGGGGGGGGGGVATSPNNAPFSPYDNPASLFGARPGGFSTFGNGRGGGAFGAYGRTSGFARWGSSSPTKSPSPASRGYNVGQEKKKKGAAADKGAKGAKGDKGAAGPGGPPSAEGKALPPRYAGHLPTRYTSGGLDRRFKTASSLVPPEDSSIPAGTPGIALAGTDDFSQQPVFHPITRRVIVPGFSGAPEMATQFCDLEPTDNVAKGVPPGIGGRQAFSQTMMRVVRMPTSLKGLPVGEGNGIAWNLRDSEQGGMSGLGLVWGRTQGGASPTSPTTPASKPAKPVPPVMPKLSRSAAINQAIGALGGVAGAAAASGPQWQVWKKTYDDIVRWRQANRKYETALAKYQRATQGGQRAPAGEGDERLSPGNTNAAALMSSDAGGPLSVGYEDDRHELGMTKDDEPINAGALSTSAIWDRSKDEKAPKEFNGPYPGGRVWDVALHVFMGYDAKSTHSGPYGKQEGLFRRYAYVPFDEEPGRVPNDVTPPPTKREPTDPKVPREPRDPGPITPGSSGAGGAGGRGGGVIARAALGQYYKDSHVMWQRAMGLGSMIFRPQTTNPAGTDFRYTNGIDAEVRAKDRASRPATMRLEAYGKEAGGVWDYQRKAPVSRIPGGESSSGGVAFMPPAFDVADYRNGAPPSNVTPGAGYVTFADNVYAAFGDPESSTGEVQDGGLRLFRASSGVKIQARTSGTWGAFTPSTDDHLATKKYVDDNSGSVAGEYGVPLNTYYNLNGGNTFVHSTPASGNAQVLVATGTIGAPTGKECGFHFTIPTGFDNATNTLKLRLRAKYAIASNISDTVDARVSAGDGGGGDIVTTAAQNLTNAYADHDFTITVTGLVAGQKLNCEAAIAQDDSGGAAAAPLATLIDATLVVS